MMVGGAQKGPHMTPITIIIQLFSDNFIGEPILNRISVDLIKFIKHHYGMLPPDKLGSFESRVNNLLELITANENRDCVWRALGTRLSDEIRAVS